MLDSLAARWAAHTGPSRVQRTPMPQQESGEVTSMGQYCRASVFANLLLVQQPIVDERDAVPIRFRVGRPFDNSDLHCNLLSCAGDVMCQRNERRFETPFVTCRLVHVAKLAVRCNQT